jgi:hypothetical protein
MTVTALFTIGVLMAPSLHAEQRGRGNENRPSGSNGREIQGDVRIVFSTGDAQIVREHYQPRYTNLPPGLQKKLARTGQLPPGWQKKMEAFPADLDRRLSPLPAGLHRGVIDGHAVIYRAGGVIVDATALF